MLGLVDFPGGSFQSSASDASADGDIVVGFANDATGQVATVWDQINGMRNLQTVLNDEFAVDTTGWVLHSATGISDDGNVITGIGTHNGNTEAFVFTGFTAVPEPSTYSMLGLAAIGFALARYRRCAVPRVLPEATSRG